MSPLVVVLLVVAYLAIGSVIAGLMDRGAYPGDDNGPFIAVMWPAYIATWVLIGIVYVAHIPFRAIYRRVRGKS